MTPAVLRAALLALFAVASAAPAHAQEVIEYYGTDHLGSVRVVFDAAGTVLSRADYLPFGEEVFAPTGPMPAEQFTGQARDGEAGQDYFHARMYQPRTGRLNAVDPVYAGHTDPQQWNRYSYARQNPVMFGDPSGLNACAYDAWVSGNSEWLSISGFGLVMWVGGGGGGFGGSGSGGGGGDYGGFGVNLGDSSQKPVTPDVEAPFDQAETIIITTPPTQDCQDQIYSKLQISPDRMRAYIGNGVNYFDGPKSKISVEGNIYPPQAARSFLRQPGSSPTVSGYFSRNRGVRAWTSATADKLTIYLRPSEFSGAKPLDVLATLIHEAFHGLTKGGLDDGTMAERLGVNPSPSFNITQRIQQVCTPR